MKGYYTSGVLFSRFISRFCRTCCTVQRMVVEHYPNMEMVRCTLCRRVDQWQNMPDVVEVVYSEWEKG